MRHLPIIVAILTLSRYCVAGSGDEFLGDWQSKKDASEAGTLKIAKSGKYFVLDAKLMGNRIKMNAIYDDGALKVSAPNGTVLVTHDSSSDTLVFFDEFVRLKAPTHSDDPHKQKQIDMLVRASRVGPAATRNMPDLEAAAECLWHIKQWILACLFYAEDHDGRFPQSVEELQTAGYLIAADVKKLQCPLKTSSACSGYQYFGGDTRRKGAVVFRSCPTKDGFHVVAFGDGGCSLVRDTD